MLDNCLAIQSSSRSPPPSRVSGVRKMEIYQPERDVCKNILEEIEEKVMRIALNQQVQRYGPDLYEDVLFETKPRPHDVRKTLFNRLFQVDRHLKALHLIKEGRSSGVYQSHNPKYADIRVAQCVGGIGGINSSGPSDQIKTFHEEWKRTFIIDENAKNASCRVSTALKMASESIQVLFQTLEGDMITVWAMEDDLGSELLTRIYIKIQRLICKVTKIDGSPLENGNTLIQQEIGAGTLLQEGMILPGSSPNDGKEESSQLRAEDSNN